MNKKLVSLLMSGAMIGAVGTSAYASTTTPTTTTSKASTTQVQSTSTSKINKATKISTSSLSTKKEQKSLKIGINYRWIKSQLEAGKTVSQIKAELISSFNANTAKFVSAKKITQDQATKKEQAYSKHLAKKNILKGVVTGNVAKDLNAGKTLSDSQNAVITKRTANINKLLSEKKITQEQATKRIDILKKEVSKGHGIFINEGLVHKIRKEIDAGKTLNQAKQDIIQTANTKAEALVKSGKIKASNLPKVEKRIQERIDHAPAFKHISNIDWVQKALNDGQTASQIKTTFVNNLNKKEAKVEANKNLSATQINKIKEHIAKLQQAISSKGIFSNIISR